MSPKVLVCLSLSLLSLLPVAGCPFVEGELDKFRNFNVPFLPDALAEEFSGGEESQTRSPAVFAVGGYSFGEFSDSTVQDFANDLAEQIGASRVVVVDWEDWITLMPEMAAAYLNGEQFVVVGFSLGNSAVIGRVLPVLNLAGVHVPVWVMLDGGYLRPDSFPVPFIVDPARDLFSQILHLGVDPSDAFSPRIPANVGWVIDLESNGPFAGRELVAEDFIDPSGVERQEYIRFDGSHDALPMDLELRQRIGAKVQEILDLDH